MKKFKVNIPFSVQTIEAETREKALEIAFDNHVIALQKLRDSGELYKAPSLCEEVKPREKNVLNWPDEDEGRLGRRRKRR